MNNLGEIQFKNEIQILDAFDFPEQFSAVKLTNIQDGVWLVFNENLDDETPDDEIAGDVVTKLLIVEKNYFQKNIAHELYKWEKQEEIISIEKGILGIFNNDFTYFEDYTDEMTQAVSNQYRAGVLKNYVVCETPYGNDDYFSFYTVKENNKIVALKIELNNC